MKRILNVFVKYRNSILYLFLLGFSLFFLKNNSGYHQLKLEKISLLFSSNLYSFSNSINRYFRLEKENQRLLKENEVLKSIQIKSNAPFLYTEGYNYKKNFPFDVKNVNIIKNSFQSQHNYIIIDNGAASGIRREMGVISNKGIIGIVQAVTDNYASVISILNQDMKINVRFKNRTSFGSLIWKGKSPKKFSVEDVVSTSSVKKGDTIITGGMSSYFPYGIPLGVITNIENNIQNGYYKIDAELLENPAELYKAYVIENSDFKEINSLIENVKQ